MAGAALLPRLRARLSPDALLAAGSVGLAAVTAAAAAVFVLVLLHRDAVPAEGRRGWPPAS